jgi:hypothetical protein
MISTENTKWNVLYDLLIDWCLTPILEVFQQYRGVKVIKNILQILYFYITEQFSDIKI